jgi:hypothetical protein
LMGEGWAAAKDAIDSPRHPTEDGGRSSYE